ncbi:MAG: c-type cytochrome [Gammaproteobacteria bacterium]
MKKTVYMLASMALMSWCSLATAGDAAAGKAVFDAKCAECHYADDFSGESESDIAGFMAEARSGAIDHESETVKEISDADAANIVTFWASQE